MPSGPEINIIGAGIGGLVCATRLVQNGYRVRMFERSQSVGPQSCSWLAGGMLAPHCERESAEVEVEQQGLEGIEWWRQQASTFQQNGSLVVSLSRDANELKRFARLTEGFKKLDGAGIRALEPDLTGFESGLFFPEEAHLDPRITLSELTAGLTSQSIEITLDADITVDQYGDLGGPVLDCRGYAAHPELPELRGVKGEMLVVRTKDVELQRPVRLLHPRYPLYIVPRGNGEFMLGATMLESDDGKRITARSMMELLNSAYALHPAFGEAEIVEIGVDVRPAFPDNLPRVIQKDQVTFVNGLFRHGFLLSPAVAAKVVGQMNTHYTR